MRDEGLGRFGDVADVVERGQVTLAVLREALNDFRAQVFGRLEEVDDVLRPEFLLQSLYPLRPPAPLDVGCPDGGIVAYQEDEAGDAALDGAEVLHLGERDVTPLGHIAVTVSEDANIDVSTIH